MTSEQLLTIIRLTNVHLEENMTTKESILQQALNFFAQKGYDGVSVREIARAVGVRESALYKHYKNKEDIFLKVIETARQRITESYIDNQVPESVQKESVADGYRALTTEQLCDIAWNLFCLYTKDPFISNFRKLLTREQYNNSYIAKQYKNIFLEGALNRQAETFASLVAGKMFKNVDPHIIALHFYGPIFYLFQLYDCEPDKEKYIKDMLFSHIETFGENYSQ